MKLHRFDTLYTQISEEQRYYAGGKTKTFSSKPVVPSGSAPKTENGQRSAKKVKPADGNPVEIKKQKTKK